MFARIFASIEDRPADGGADRPHPAAAREPVARAEALQPGRADQRELREEIRRGHADLGRRRGQLSLRVPRQNPCPAAKWLICRS
jgi:hypothetical protein